VVSEVADVAALAREAPLTEVPVAASSAAGGTRTAPGVQTRGDHPSTSATSGPSEAAPATPRRRGRRQAGPGATKAPKKPAGAPAPRKRTAPRGKTPKAVE